MADTPPQRPDQFAGGGTGRLRASGSTRRGRRAAAAPIASSSSGDNRSPTSARVVAPARDGESPEEEDERTPQQARREVQVHFGELNEGTEVGDAILEEDSTTVLAYNRRWQRRNGLRSQYANTPIDGLANNFFRNALIRFPIRTPPGSVRQTSANGDHTVARVTGYSFTRQEDDAWQEYLDMYRLPQYAFTEQHMRMIEQYSGEVEALDLNTTEDTWPITNGSFGDQVTAHTRQFLFDHTNDEHELDVFMLGNENAMLNLPYLPEGRGIWQWVSPDDANRAQALNMGITRPVDIALLREAQILPLGPAAPNVIWIPEARFFNPRQHPDVPGTFQYHTQDDRDLANLNFGGQDVGGTGLLMPRNPHPEFIWTMQQNARRTGALPHIHDINIVFIPTGETHDPDVSTLALDDVAPGTGPLPASYQYDPSAELQGAPTHNGTPGGFWDQTAPPHPEYQPCYERIDFKAGERSILVLDRSTAKRNWPEPHKFRIFTRTGVQTFSGRKDFDWSSVKDIASLNKWREHGFAREGLKSKSKKNRPLYTAAQREWLHKELELNAERGRPYGGAAALKTRFDRRFRSDPPRTQGGLLAEFIRMSKAGAAKRKQDIIRVEAQEDKQKKMVAGTWVPIAKRAPRNAGRMFPADHPRPASQSAADAEPEANAEDEAEAEADPKMTHGDGSGDEQGDDQEEAGNDHA